MAFPAPSPSPHPSEAAAAATYRFSFHGSGLRVAYKRLRQQRVKRSNSVSTPTRNNPEQALKRNFSSPVSLFRSKVNAAAEMKKNCLHCRRRRRTTKLLEASPAVDGSGWKGLSHESILFPRQSSRCRGRLFLHSARFVGFLSHEMFFSCGATPKWKEGLKS